MIRTNICYMCLHVLYLYLVVVCGNKKERRQLNCFFFFLIHLINNTTVYFDHVQPSNFNRQILKKKNMVVFGCGVCRELLVQVIEFLYVPRSIHTWEDSFWSLYIIYIYIYIYILAIHATYWLTSFTENSHPSHLSRYVLWTQLVTWFVTI